MTLDNEKTRKTSACSVEATPGEVDAGADLTILGSVACSHGCDLRGRPLLIKDQGGALAVSIELAEFDGETNRTGEIVMAAPARPGDYTWLAVSPAHAEDGIQHEEISAPFSFTVQPHRTHVVVWDVPSAIECGERFSIKIGVKCSSECRPDGWSLEVRDHDGRELAKAAPADEPWPGTTALYYAEVDLTAPNAEGLHTWEAKASATDTELPHGDCIAGFGVRAVPAPECVLRVEAVDMESRAPVKGAKVVVHPYRAFTDERGMAEMRVPRGEYRLFVSGKDYFPFRSDGEVTGDTTIMAELAVDRGLTDADVWS